VTDHQNEEARPEIDDPTSIEYDKPIDNGEEEPTEPAEGEPDNG
jgi:hypothetical protein